MQGKKDIVSLNHWLLRLEEKWVLNYRKQPLLQHSRNNQLRLHAHRGQRAKERAVEVTKGPLLLHRPLHGEGSGGVRTAHPGGGKRGAGAGECEVEQSWSLCLGLRPVKLSPTAVE